ncbi:MAG TPA: hypothetical protein VFP54_09760 [Acidimicrobiales bacterium]|nr:hypothetical protein [Acidimicrobiales bacterium]
MDFESFDLKRSDVMEERLGKHSTLTHHLDRLVTGGLVERVRGRDDRRTSSAVLTARGRAHLRKTGRIAYRMDAEFRSLFSPSELATLRPCRERIVGKYGEAGL